MTPERLCLSLEKSKKLVELGLRVESYFQWIPIDAQNSEFSLRHGFNDYTPAPTLQELLDLMPKEINEYSLTLTTMWDYAQFRATYLYDEDPLKEFKELERNPSVEKSPIEALGDLAIYLLENKLWEVEG